MRSHSEMMKLIFSKAEDERILLVTQEGSRNSNEADAFSDYDITYFVEDIDTFDDTFIEDFGEIMILQKPEAMACLKHAKTYLMMFQDGNRIDLKIAPLCDLETYLHEENVHVLLDKRNLCLQKDYINHTYEIEMLSYSDALACINEFYWISLYVLKGILRHDLLYANYYFTHICMEECLKMMSFDIQLQHQEKLKLGKCYKRIFEYIDHRDHELMNKWFHTASTLEMGEALLSCMSLFEAYAKDAFSQLNWSMPKEVENVTNYVYRKLNRKR
ncbi:aminoglycoside 6-adenylyltransferase [Traorella massiliensis]|uniref:aminoglycoside 6-adenylyltransferase n=1 Tax=Traorella massiliensis TaxID=1903263 RepID=UPI002355546F|nr:aminoglycoside 6-adenylyltransferase [Traorella massiliensis]